ncbi:MAG: hypothetical protein PHI12_01545 [Dehalococcoidales bacterium]|nr:hypothetical protein [Dehalococcoidales bacterium]
MITATPAPAPPPASQGGHCSQCGKVWVLNKRQGVCPWCGKPASQQHSRTQALRSIKSSRRRRQKQARSSGNGYDQLEGNWLTYYKVASRFSGKSKPEDREDLLHDIMLTLADVERNNGHKPFTEAVMYRIASHSVADYWRAYYRTNSGLDCHSCSKAQRAKCKENDLYRECPKAIKLESLSKPVIDSEGNTTELGELIADDKALELGAWVSESIWELGYKPRLVAIAHKLHKGEALNNYDRVYLTRYRKQEQKTLLQ